MEQIVITKSEAVLYLTLINTVIGILFGSFPLILGFIMKNRKYGFYGFIFSVIGGTILGVPLSYPVAAIFTWLILRKSAAKEDDVVVAVSENSNENSVEDLKNS